MSMGSAGVPEGSSNVPGVCNWFQRRSRAIQRVKEVPGLLQGASVDFRANHGFSSDFMGVPRVFPEV